MKLGIGPSPWIYWQSDDKATNLFDARCIGSPGRSNPAITWDDNGWPTYLPPGVSSGWYILPMGGYLRPGRYRITAKGSGKFYIAHPDIPGSESVPDVKSKGPGIVGTIGEWDMKHTADVLSGILETDPADPLREIRMSRVGIDPAATFTPEYVAELKNFAALRLGGFTGVVASPDVDWPPSGGGVSKWMAGIELCNATGCNPWINIPHMASDDYVKNVARLIRDNLKPMRKVYIEYSIEIWNWGPPFYTGTKWVQDWTAAHHPNLVAQHGHAILAGHVQDVFAAEAPGVPIVRMIGNQLFNVTNFVQNLEVAADPQWKVHFDAVATAPYADPGMANIDWATIDPLLAKGDAASMDRAVGLVFEAYTRVMSLLDVQAAQYKALADKHNMRMLAYECGPGWQISPFESPAHLNLFAASYHDPRMKTFLSDVYFPWMSKYYDLAMYTQHVRKPSPGEDWGVRGTAGETPAPKLEACLAWCAAHNGESEPEPTPPPTPIPPQPLKGVMMKVANPNPLAYSLVRASQVRNFKSLKWEAVGAAPTADQFRAMSPAGPGLFAGLQSATIDADGIDLADDARVFGDFRLGPGDYHIVGDPSALLAASKVFTWACWYKSKGTAVPNGTMIGEGSTKDGRPLFQLRTDETAGTKGGVVIRDLAGVLKSVTGSVPIADGQWHHVAATCDGKTLALYADGKADGSISVAGLGAIATDRLCFGGLYRSSFASPIAGELGDVRGYRRALSAAEVATVYARWLAGPSGGGGVDVVLWSLAAGVPSAIVGTRPLSEL